MHSRFSYLAVASLAALVFSGCEWGGSHDNTWNDAYAWADFTGTYRFVNAIIIPGDDGGEDGTVIHHGTGTGRLSTSSGASGKVSPVGTGIIPGTFSMSIDGVGVSDVNKDGILILDGNSVGTVSYTGGGWSITAYVGKPAGAPINITYDYKTVGPYVTPTGTETVPISYLNVIQQGNKFTMTGDSGIKYTGKMTGSNVSKDDYVAARTVNISFEVSSANGQRIVGNFSGIWSGASDTHYGVLSNRKVNGTHSRAGNFVGVAADKSIYINDIVTTEIGPSSFTDPSNQ